MEAIYMEIDNRNGVSVDPAIGDSAIPNLGGGGIRKHPRVAK